MRVIDSHRSSSRLALALVLAFALGAGCDGSLADRPLDGPPGPGPDAGAADARWPGSDQGWTPDGAGPPPVLVDVGHERELRAVWVATVGNIDFPSQQGLSAAAQQAELTKILDTVAAAHLNVVMFQVRPEGDALYASQLEPWSRYLTGTQGQDPGYDPLAFLVAQARQRSIEVHAWLNPYRAKASASSGAVAPHVSVTMPQHMRSYGNLVWMDPGVQAVADHTVAVAVDLVRRYDIDGVHLDDYFYPYPDGSEFPDASTYAAYQGAGGTLSKGDWRRDNVNRLVERLAVEIGQAKPHVRFGISPFGIYRPGMPPGITGLDQYAEIYADPPLWKAEGWVDYLAPQLYWPSTKAAQAFGPLIDWWSVLPRPESYTFAGIYLSKLGTSSEWSMDELRTQVGLCRARRDENAAGNIYFSFKPLLEDRLGVVSVFRDELYPELALSPPLAVATVSSEAPVAPPRVQLAAGGQLSIDHPDAAQIRYWVVYALTPAAGPRVHQIVAAELTPSLSLDPGRWALTAVARNGLESRGVLVDL